MTEQLAEIYFELTRMSAELKDAKEESVKIRCEQEQKHRTSKLIVLRRAPVKEKPTPANIRRGARITQSQQVCNSKMVRPLVQPKSPNLATGIHYELPNGEIAFVVAIKGKSNTVHYYLDDGKGVQTVLDAEFQTWRPRPDLLDFPNARDPRLPRLFETLWGLKHLSELKAIMATEHPGLSRMKEYAEQFKLPV